MDDYGDDDGKEYRDGGRLVFKKRCYVQIGDNGSGEQGTEIPDLGLGGVVHDPRAAAVHDGVYGIEAYPVEHDGGYDLVYVEICLENARDSAPESAEYGRAYQTGPPGQAEDYSAEKRPESPHSVLSCRSDIEKAGLEGKSDGKAGQDERSGGCYLLAYADRREVETAH